MFKAKLTYVQSTYGISGIFNAQWALITNISNPFINFIY